MIRNFAIIGVAILCVVNAPANASTIQWNLENVVETSNPTLSFTGFFDYDTSLGMTSASPDFSITELVSGSPSATWSTATGGTGTFDVSSFGPRFTFFSSEIPGGGALIADNPLGFDGSQSTMPLDVASVIAAPGMGQTAVTGSVTDLPLPAGLPLFAMAILSLGFAAWRNSSPVQYKFTRIRRSDSRPSEMDVTPPLSN